MREIGVYDAKTQLPRLLDDVEQGETVTITRHGRPVARLVPVRAGRPTRAEAVDALLAFRAQHSLEGLSVRDLIEEGRNR